MTTLISKDNTKWRMYFNESVVLPDLGSRLIFDINDLKTNFKLEVEFVFSDGGEKLKSETNITNNGYKIIITLFQWKTENGFGHVEVTEPLKLNTQKGERLWLKYRTQTNDKSNFRNFHLTVWGEEHTL